MIHGLATLFGGFNSDGKVLLELGLAREIGQPGGTKSGFELTFAIERRPRLAHAIAPAPALCGTSVRRRNPARLFWLFAPQPRPTRGCIPNSIAPTTPPVQFR